MQHQEFDPPEELRGAIKCFWYNSRDLGELPSAFEVQPDGYAEIIFYFGSPLSISYHGSLRPFSSPFMIGLLDQPVLLTTRHRFEVIGVRCFPWTVFDLLGLPASKDALRTMEHPVARLQPVLEKLIQAGHVEEAVSLLRQYFLDTRLQVAGSSLLFKAGAAMRQAKGTLPVSKVAAAAHATIRTLERAFKRSSGHTVKDVSALMRFEQVRNRLLLEQDCNLAGLAQELGYTDQSHLSREFKRYSGTTPAAFARKTKELGVSGVFVAFVQA